MKIKLLQSVLSLAIILCLFVGTAARMSGSNKHRPQCDYDYVGILQ